ncbi:unnamed protein product [Closterium sp. NIES-65]|nr:unnamed protein product [Closterium sp. NIES-65]
MRRAEPYFRGLINEDFVVRRANYEDTKGRCPPYMIYVDHEARDICLAVRGLKSSQIKDYEILLDQKKGSERLDGGFVHTGMLKAAAWLLDQEMPVLTMLARCHPAYTLTLTGHSLGSGVVAMATVILHASRERVGFSLRRLRCFCMAPARSMSLNLAIKYADVINSVVLQDDFLARTSAPVRSALAAGFCLPCMLLYKYQQDALISTADKLKDPRRLYAPGRLFHVLYRPQVGMKQYPHPVVKTAVPVDHRFERVVLSPSIIYDHIIGHIEAKCALALAEMEAEQQEQQTPPEQQRMQRSSTLKERRGEHLEALARAVSLHVAHAADPSSMPHLHSDEPEETQDDMGGRDGEEGANDADGVDKGGGGAVDGERGGELGGSGAEAAMERVKAEVERVRAEVENAAGVVAGKWSEIVDGLVAKAAEEVTKVAPGLAEDNAQEWQ